MSGFLWLVWFWAWLGLGGALALLSVESPEVRAGNRDLIGCVVVAGWACFGPWAMLYGVMGFFDDLECS